MNESVMNKSAMTKSAMNDDKSWMFTCKTCGSHDLNVFRAWTILAGAESEHWLEWGPLEADHSWHFEFKKKIETQEDSDERVEQWLSDFAVYAKDNSSSGPKEYETEESESNPGNDRFYVRCAGCDREIEFGWSQPNRGGHIFPVECADFNPAGIWPEPRYLNAWQKRGWLQREESRP